MFRHIKPSCSAYPTNYTQLLQAINKINPGTREDPTACCPQVSDTETFYCVTKQHPQAMAAVSVVPSATAPTPRVPGLLPLLVGVPGYARGRSQAVRDFPSHPPSQGSIRIKPYTCNCHLLPYLLPRPASKSF